MTMTDPIADLLIRLRNAIGAKHETLVIPSSKIKLEIVRILKEEGYIANYAYSRDDKQGKIQVTLRYAPGKPRVCEQGLASLDSWRDGDLHTFHVTGSAHGQAGAGERNRGRGALRN